MAMTSNTAADSAAATSPHRFQGLEDGAVGLRADVLDLYASLQKLGLLEHVAELDIKGLTVIPPEKVASPELIERLRTAVLDVLARRHGVQASRQDNLEGEYNSMPFGKLMSYLLLEDAAFQDMLMNQTLQAIASYRLGKNCCLSSVQAAVKSRGGPALALHTDELYVAPPYSQYTTGTNLTVALTDYSAEDGPTIFVPGSHKLRRQPVGNEGYDQIERVEARAGSLIVWDGALWHGSQPRRSEGLRLSVIYYLMRPHMRVQEDYQAEVSAEVLARHPPRFAAMLGKTINLGWKHQGPRLDGADTLVGSSPYC